MPGKYTKMEILAGEVFRRKEAEETVCAVCLILTYLKTPPCAAHACLSGINEPIPLGGG